MHHNDFLNIFKPWSWDSKEFLRKKLIGKGVVFRITSAGFHNRRYAEVYLPTGEDVREDIVLNGWAEVYSNGNEKSESRSRLIELEAKAKEQKRGIWNTSSNGIRKLPKEIDPIEFFNSSLKGKHTKAIIHQVKTGSTFKAYLPESHHTLTLSLSGVQSPAFLNSLPLNQQQPYSRESKFFSEIEVLHRDVDIVFEGVDKGSTFFGTILYNNGTNLSERLLQEGLATYVDWSGSKTSKPKVLKAAEEAAKEEKLRIWSSPKLNNSSKKVLKKNEFFAYVTEVLNAATIVVAPVKEARGVGEEVVINFSSIELPVRMSRGKFKSLPENEKNAAYYSLEGKEALRKTVIGKKVKCVLDYVRPSFTGKDEVLRPEKEFYSVYLDKKNIALDLLKQGLLAVKEHGVSDNRSPDFNDYLTAERVAMKKSLGIHSKSSAPSLHFTNFTAPLKDETTTVDKNKDRKKYQEQINQAQASRFTQHLPHLQRAGRVSGVVERVFSGSKFHIWIEKETCLIPFTLLAVRCERFSEEDGQSVGSLAYEWAKSNLFQRDVELVVDAVDTKGGNFSGVLFLEGKDISISLLSSGFAKMFDKAARACKAISFDDYKRAENQAKQARRGVWIDYDEEAEARKREEALAQREAERQEKRKAASFNVKITEIINGTGFYFQPVGEEAEKANKSLEELKSFNIPEDDSFTPKVGDLVAAEFSGEWYRARLVAANDGKFKAFYVDYGNTALIGKQDIRLLPEQFSENNIKLQARRGELAFITSPSLDDEIGVEAAHTFQDLTWDKELLATVEQVEDDVSYVVLKTPSQEVNEGKEGNDVNDVSINEILLEEGLARLTKTRFEKSHILKKLRSKEDIAKKSRRNIWEYGDIGSDEE